jgi:hypothetical protein
MTRKRAITVLDTNNDGTLQPTSVADYVARNTSQRAHRVRTWDQANRSKPYRVPDAFMVDAKIVRTFCVKRAASNMTNTDTVASALIEHALAAVRNGTLPVAARPDPRRRNLTLKVVDGPTGWPESQAQEKSKKPKDKSQKDRYINYRWGSGVDTQIESLAKDKGIPQGELVVFLLKWMVDLFDQNAVHFQPESVTTQQVVSIVSGPNAVSGWEA